MEILLPNQYDEYEAFVASHPQGSIYQSVLWQKVKSNWGFEAVVSRGEDGAIRGAMGVLVQKVPLFGTSFLYAPRGPVCDYRDKEVLADLKAGADALAKKHSAHLFKVDPDLLHDEPAVANFLAMGFKQITGGDGFETIQPRFNYRLYLEGRNQEQLMMNFTQKTRYNIRVAQKHGVEIRVVGQEHLDDFMRLMEVTGKRDGFTVRPRSYFARMLDVLGDHVRLYMAFYEGQAVSGAICTNYGDKACYLYGASDNLYRNVMPNYLIQWEMIRWAEETGCTVYDFQGVSGNLDESNPLYGLYRFKKGFSGSLDELAGEFDYLYRPITARLVDLAIDLNEAVRHLRRRLSR